MTSGFNKVMLMGNVTRDLELKSTNNGTPVCSFDIAVNDSFQKDASPTFMRIVTFKNQAESCARFLKKGKPVMVEGRIQTSTWVDQAGVQQKRQEIVARVVKFLGNREDNNSALAV